MMFFGIAALLLYVSINTYVILRGWNFIELVFVSANKKAYILSMILLASLYILAMLLLRDGSNSFSKWITYVGSMYMLAVMYVFLFLVTIDIIRVIAYFIKPLNKVISQNTKNLTVFSGIVIIIVILGIIIIGAWYARIPRVTQYQINLSKKVDKFDELKVVMLSDLHLGQIVDRKRLKSMVDKVNSLNPDLVIMAGDIIDGSYEPYVKEGMSEEIKRIKSKHGVFGVVGNHEYFGPNFDNTVKILKDSGIKLLIDENYLLEDSIYIVGRNDRSGKSFLRMERKSIGDLINDIDVSMPIILIDHQPFSIDESVSNAIDLHLSGHTHHGQVWPASMITNKMYDIDWGYMKKEMTNVLVSCGVGTWGPPVRIGSYSEIVEINLKFLK